MYYYIILDSISVDLLGSLFGVVKEVYTSRIVALSIDR